jgi:hypothetical protein
LSQSRAESPKGISGNSAHLALAKSPLAVVLVKGSNPGMGTTVIGNEQIRCYGIPVRHFVTKMKTDVTILFRAIQDLDSGNIERNLETNGFRDTPA